MITKAEILGRMVKDDKYLEVWRLMERVLRTNRRYSIRSWLFAHEMIQATEKLKEEAES